MCVCVCVKRRGPRLGDEIVPRPPPQGWGGAAEDQCSVFVKDMWMEVEFDFYRIKSNGSSSLLDPPFDSGSHLVVFCFFFEELKCVIDLSLRLDLTKRQRIKEEEKGTKKNQKIQNRPARCTKRVAHTRTAGARRRRRFFCFLLFLWQFVPRRRKRVDGSGSCSAARRLRRVSVLAPID